MTDPPPVEERLSEAVDVENAVDAYLRTFAANGVDFFFNSPGTEYAPFWEQFAETTVDGIPTSEHGIGYIGCRHEELAVHMAMGYTLIEGRPQVVGLHVNVGSHHAAMSIHGAYQSRIPMCVVTSHADTHENELRGGTPGSHYLGFNAPGGFESHFAPFCKWVAHPERPASVPRYLARGFRIATASPSGPVMLNLARELLYDETLERAPIRREATAPPTTPAREPLLRVAAQLDAAANPLIIAGMTGRHERGRTELVSLAETLGAPVIESPKFHHGFPVEHPLSLGDRTFADHYLDMAVDLVLVVDSPAPWYPPEAAAPAAKRIMIAPDPAHAHLDYWNYPADVLLAGDPVATMAALREAVNPQSDPGPVDWPAEHDNLRAYWQELADAGRERTPLDPFWLCRELDGYLADDAIVVGETTVHKGVINNLIERRDRDYIGAGRMIGGGRGGGLGMALGAKLAAPDRQVVALIGDGAYSYNPVSAALGAAQEHRLPILIVVFDNQGYRSQAGTLLGTYPDGRAARSGLRPGTDIDPSPDYATEAEAYGAFGVELETPGEVADAFEESTRALADGRTALVHAVLEASSPRDRLEPPS